MKTIKFLLLLISFNNLNAQCLDVTFPKNAKVCLENEISQTVCLENTYAASNLPDFNGNLNINFHNGNSFNFNKLGIFSLSSPNDAIIKRSNVGNLIINANGVDRSIFFNYSNPSVQQYYGEGGTGGINIFDGGTTNFAKLWITRGNTSSGLNQLPGNLVISPSGGKVIIANGTNIFNIPIGVNYKLIVQDGILTEKVKVAVRNSTQWSDHVFEERYNLKPLEEVEKYIKENKHLPNIPSSEDLVKDGLDLGEMQAKQMEKIEELTLYLIEMKKDIEILKKENIDLKNKLSKNK
jgi:hypothetical protein